VKGSQHRPAGGEGQVFVGLVKDVPEVTLVLTEDELEPNSVRGSLSIARSSRRRMKPGVARQ
jgi:hypothetical protein